MPELGEFYDTLDELVAGQRADSARVLWLGDSHTAADFMTGVVRQRFAAGFGWPAAGFVRVGLGGYRHGSVSVEVTGKWRKAPILPAQRTRVLDGVFGYGGIRTIPESGASVTIKQPREHANEALVYTLSFRAGPGSSIAVRVGDREHVVEGGGQPEQARFEAPLGEAIHVAHRSGTPEIFGLFVDTAAPRLVLDTVGIDGARLATTLAWEPEQFERAVHERAPSLVVLAFGTNEVFDQTRVSHYAEHLEQLVALLRRASANVPCLVLGPADAPGVSEPTRPRVVEITNVERDASARLGCAFFSLYEAMGGEGSFRRWVAARPGLARGDGIHFMIAGYQKLGGLVADALLGPIADAAPATGTEPLVALHQRAVEPRP